ncbi:MAG: cytochrome c3 family protein [Sulfuricurvum sp.]|jgi:predicted CXXCH cytochrome family protein|uniref:cytochrome c3 family protein n=1 Tax=Sulfuricurvum sp. TaxID=2025608 RepID=UPI0025D3E81E|nr:cytochrome c3 family protein [Sulfuricurvum sp.]MCK9374222.1 cytochrome c3 family protein [Sulfuricurvum sp.]
MKYFVSVFIFLPLILGAQNKKIEFDTIFHKELPLNTANSNDPECRICHLSTFQVEKSTAKTALADPLTMPTHATATSDSSTNDSFSVACLHCHDGICAQNAPVKLPGCIPAPSKKGASYASIESHPIFNRYPFEKKDLRPLDEPLPKIWKSATTVKDLLRHGEIVCISCHLPHHTKQTGFLRAPMQQSQLCFGCHKK